MSFFGLDKIGRIIQIIKSNGGFRRSIGLLYRTDDLKLGKLVGTDKYGNQYFENNEYFYGRNRWVIYSAKHGLEYDGSQVPAEWFGWLHYKTDLPPTIKPPVNYPWIIDHNQNPSGTDKAYVPFTTTQPKIESWVPPKPSSKPQAKSK